eukprot:scaffold4105_cov112-Skeletonema_menzelii.AAC.2
MNLVPSLAAFFLLCNPVPVVSVDVGLFRRSRDSCTCLNGRCDQTACPPGTAQCVGGGNCIQDGTEGPSCLSGKCSQQGSINPICVAGQCDQRGATNPDCWGGGCCRETLDTSAATCFGGVGQTGHNDNACGPNAKGCRGPYPPKSHADVSAEESRFLRA